MKKLLNKFKFKFKCMKCNNVFKATLGTKCPNCDSQNVKIIIKFN